MPLLSLILTCPFALLAHKKKLNPEEFISLKFLGIWLLCQSYITLNDNFRVPLGIICAILIVYNDKNNRNAKLAALVIGIISLMLSSLIYLILSN
jgi:hypothetical protein